MWGWGREIPQESFWIFIFVFTLFGISPVLIQPPDKCGVMCSNICIFPPDAHQQPIKCLVTRSFSVQRYFINSHLLK